MLATSKGRSLKGKPHSLSVFTKLLFHMHASYNSYFQATIVANIRSQVGPALLNFSISAPSEQIDLA
jgi:hypothetical protein